MYASIEFFVKVTNLPKAIKFLTFVLNGIVENPLSMLKDALHGAIEYETAQLKKNVEIRDTRYTFNSAKGGTKEKM